MLPRVDANVAPLARAGAEAVGDSRQAVFQRSLQGLLGKPMEGEVMSRLTDGSFVVKVGNLAARMMLPAGAEPGKQVPLTLVALEPRPTFQVGNGPHAPVTVAQAYPDGAAEPAQHSPPGTANAGTAGQARASLAATLLGKAPLTPAAQLPGFDPGAPAPTLSSAGRAIASVLVQADNRPAAAQTLLGSAPLSADPADTPRLAHTLQQTVATSGLFYESHVAEWADGKRPLTELMREPQMLRQAQGGAADGRAPGLPDAAAAQLINLQLHTHEQARVQWQGQAWPGQAMEWDIHKDAPGDGKQERGADGEPLQVWRSGVRFQFPGLGAVSASVVLVGGQIHIQMQTASEASAGALRANAGALEHALEAAGSPLTSLSIALPQAPPDAQ
ncbi:MAG: flagellar hook-length control protein FliK [Pseudomonadota bacterium]